MKTKEELIAVLKRYGARDPEAWAESEVEEGIPQLARYLFLHGAWNGVIADGDTSWIEDQIRQNPPDSNQPFSGIAHGLRKLKNEGADMTAVSEVVRGMQASVVFHIAYLLSDPGTVTEADEVNWALFEMNDDGDPQRTIGGLHESVLETDPTGREMRPRSEKKG